MCKLTDIAAYVIEMLVAQPVPRTVEELRQEVSQEGLLDILEKQQQLQVHGAVSRHAGLEILQLWPGSYKW